MFKSNNLNMHAWQQIIKIHTNRGSYISQSVLTKLLLTGAKANLKFVQANRDKGFIKQWSASEHKATM